MKRQPLDIGAASCGPFQVERPLKTGLRKRLQPLYQFGTGNCMAVS